MPEKFVHLNVHSEYSVVDGIVRVNNLIDAAVANNMPAVAVTDHNNLFAMVKFFKSAVAKGIKPIFGAELWVENDLDAAEDLFKVIVLCKNKVGYKNLSIIISDAYLFNQKLGKAIVKLSWLKDNYSGLILISHPGHSDFNNFIKKDHAAKIPKRAKNWQKIFSDDFYFGISKIGRAFEQQYIDSIIKIAETEQVPVVALNEVCFIKQEDFDAHDARVCIHDGNVLIDPNRDQKYTDEQYFKSSEQMVSLFKDIPEVIENTVEIAKKCNLILELGNVYLPNFPVPDGMSLESYFNQLSKEGLEQRFTEIFKIDDLESIKDKTQEYYERLKIELEVINKMGFAGYFLIVADFIKWAKENDIPVGPGRGSGAGSLVAYSLLITNLDPLEYDLLFERFLNPERVSMPDFDIDFCMEGRDRVIEYVSNKYGKEAVSQIITYGTMAAKAVVRDVGRVLSHPYGFVDKIAKLIPMELGITLDKALEDESLREIYDSEEEVKNLVDLAKKLEGVTRNVGKHAGGVVIAPSKLTDFTPIYCEEGENQLVSQFDKNDIEEIGLVKFDFLGLRTLTIINWAILSINESRNINNKQPINIDDIPLDDLKTFELLCSCKTTAVFQLESRGMKDLIRRLKPDRFEDIVALVALFRPGPLQSGMVDDFVDRKLGRAVIEYPHPKLEPILNTTYGVILYQEQVMQIAQELAGYTLGAADMLRRAMGKKKPEEMAKQRDIFTKGAIENDIDKNLATYIFDLMEKFAGYGFNKSHSAAYALISYQTAWLKTHYPAEFMAAVLSSDMTNTDKVVIFIEDCSDIGLKVVSPDINQSIYKFSVNKDGKIAYGLGAVKGVGEAAINNVIEVRSQSGDFKNFFDFCQRVDLRKVTKRVLEALIKSGTFDSITKHRAYLMDSIETATKAADQYHQDKLQGQFDLFGVDTESEQTVDFKADEATVELWPDNIRLQGEKDTLGLYLTGHPINQYLPDLKKMGCHRIRELRPESRVKKSFAGLIIAIRTMITKRGDKMAFITLDDGSARQEVAIFANLFLDCKEILKKDDIVIVKGEVATDDYSGGLRVRADSVHSLEAAQLGFAKSLELDFSVSSDNIEENGLDIVSKVKDALMECLCNPEENDGIYITMNYQIDNIKSKIIFGTNWCISPQSGLLNKLNSISKALKAKFCYN